MKKLITFLFAVLASTLACAHVGSPDVFYEADAGPYHLFVTVRLPMVIPGVAEIEVRSATPDVQVIKFVPLRLSGPGSNLPSIPDVAERSKQDPQFFTGKLWFMEFGALRVHLDVNGTKGKAELSVPVASYTRQRLQMSSGLHGLLGFFLVFMTVGVGLTVGPVVRESTVPPGEEPPQANKKRGRTATIISLIIAAVVIAGCYQWWTQEAYAHERNVDLLKPPQAETELRNGNQLLIRPVSDLVVPGGSKFKLPRKVELGELIPDHGHIMHMFLVSTPGMDKIWHLHPDYAKGGEFSDRLPAMPAGQYKLFGDIVDKEGYPWTLVGDVNLPQIAGAPLSGDDSTWEGAKMTTPPSGNKVAQLPDGTHMVWERGDEPLKARVPHSFKFRVEEKDGSPAHGLEPYMGMAAHAQIICTDMSVFAHIHPAGSVSMASLDLAQGGPLPAAAGPSGMAMNMPGMAHAAAELPPEVGFPYGFPHAGDYRVFVQIKRLGKVETAAFDVHVQ